MKKCFAILAIAVVFVSCENGEIDEAKIDSAGEELQQKVEAAVDTVGSTLDRWEDSLDDDDDVDTLIRK